jgi:hypothetical protein
MSNTPVNLAATTPSLLPDQIRAASQQAFGLATEPSNAFDNNPFITREWMIVAQELRSFAAKLEDRLDMMFEARLTPLPIAARRS